MISIAFRRAVESVVRRMFGTPSTQAFGDTASIGTSLLVAQSDHKHVMPANPNQLSKGSAVWGIDASSETGYNLANNATFTPFGGTNNFAGLILINDPTSTGVTGLFIVGGSAVVKVSESIAEMTTTQGNVGTLNVYLVANAVTIENKLGADIVIRVWAIRIRNAL